MRNIRQGLTLWMGCLVTFFLLPIQTSWGWIDTGHKIVALIAWEDLTPKTRTAVTALLKQHPRYQADLLLDLPANSTPDDTARHAFAVAATWPDMVRAQSHPMRATFNHAPWHYIDIPFEDGAKATDTPPSNEPGPHDAVEALLQCTAELKDGATLADKKAIDVCWVEHLIGDIHQPLHTVTRFSPQFPKGDAGGNGATVLRDPPYPDSRSNLHLIWDSLPGDFKSEFIDRYLATGLRSDPQFSREHFKAMLGTKDFAGWAKASYDLAVQYAYLNGHLEVALSRRGGPATGGAATPTPGLPPGYMENAERIAMQQVALSGYRLADVLNSILDPKP